MKMGTNYVTIKINQYILLIRLKIKSATDKPKGVVDTRDIQKVTSTGKTEFCFEIPNHKFELKADTEAIKQMWMMAVSYLSTEGKKNMSLEEAENRKRLATTDRNWKTQSMDSTELDKIQMENESIEINFIYIQEKILRTESSCELSNQQENSNDDILKAKGIKEYFDNIDPKLLQNRVMMGWLKKRNKALIKTFQKRWYILVSAKPIRKDLETDEAILSESYLPPWMDLETLYYYDDLEILTNSTFLGELHMKYF